MAVVPPPRIMLNAILAARLFHLGDSLSRVGHWEDRPPPFPGVRVCADVIKCSQDQGRSSVAIRPFIFDRISLTELLKRTWAEIRADADDVFGRAAQLAYSFFLALFPFLIWAIAALSVFGTADRGRMLLFGFVARFLPPPAFDLIVRTFGEIIATSGRSKCPSESWLCSSRLPSG